MGFEYKSVTKLVRYKTSPKKTLEVKHLKPNGLPDYYRQKINLHDELERQFREELLKLDQKKPVIDPDIALREEVEALLKNYNISPARMLEILS